MKTLVELNPNLYDVGTIKRSFEISYMFRKDRCTRSEPEAEIAGTIEEKYYKSNPKF